MELNIYATYEQKLNCTFKNDFSNLANFHQSMFRSLKIGTLIGSFYRKWKMYELKLYRRVSCHDMMLKRNSLIISKLIWGICQILTQALENLKNLPFNGILLNKVYNVWALKRIGELCLMTLNTDARFEGKMTCAFKADMRNFSKFSPEHYWKFKTWDFVGILLSKVENVKP